MPKKVTTNKFKENPFAKKYKSSLLNIDEVIDNANQVKSWNRSPISQTVNLTYLFLGVIIGFSVCAIVVTPLVINSI